MSRISKIKSFHHKPSIARGVDQIAKMINEQGNSLVSAQTLKNVCSMESISEEIAIGVQQSVASLEDQLKSIIVDAMGIEDYSEHQLEAAAIALAASADPLHYSSEAYKSAKDLKVSDAVQLMSGVNGAYDYTDQVSVEAFSEQELRANLPLAVAYNFLASRQNDFGETFFPTQTLTPDQAALLLKVRKYNVFERVRHDTSGKETNFKFRNLVEAARDYTVLGNQATLIVPIWDSGVNDTYFMDTAYAASGSNVVVDGYTVVTRPLKPGVDLDVLGISQHPGLLASGLQDQTDAVDANVTLGAILINVNDGTHSETFRFPTKNLPRAGFNKTQEGNYREIGLQFPAEGLILDANTLTIAGAQNVVLHGLGGAVVSSHWKVLLSTEMSGRMNTETGKTNVFSGGVAKAHIIDDTGVEISQASGVGATIAGMTMKVVGYELVARRSDANKRIQGLLGSPTEEEDRYVIPLGAPITSTSPIGTNRDAADLTTLVNMTRVRNSNNAVTTLLDYADTLLQYVANAAQGVKANVQGIGRHLVTPFFERTTLDLPTVINSLTSTERANDVSSAMVNAIREKAVRMIRQSGYLQALDILSGGQDMGYEVIIGTDQYISRFLMISGDTRTLGQGIDSTVVVSPDMRLDNTIVISLRRKNVQGYDPLTFGSMAYIPELASSIQVTRNGAVYKEATVQPRTLHIPVLPILAIIDVTGLKEVLTENVPLTANATVTP